MELYIARHGETFSNIERRLTGGRLNSPLTENGIEQAKQLGKSLENITFDAVYSSTLNRAVDTVKHAFGDKYRIITDERLTEIHLGIMEGMKIDEVPESVGLFWTDPPSYKQPAGGESLEEMLERFNTFIDDIMKKNYDKVFILTHGYALRVLYACLIDKRVTTISEAPRYSNCEIVHYILEDGKWEIREERKITIRKALPADAYAYTLCHIACWQAAYRGIIPDEFLSKMPAEAERRTERFRQSLSEHDREFYCVMNENRMVGRLIFGKSRDEDKPEAGEIDAIYLIKEFWGKGHGKEMLDFAMERLKSMGYSEVILWTLEENSRGRRFYEKHGFVHDSSKKELEFGKSLTCVRYVFNINEGDNK